MTRALPGNTHSNVIGMGDLGPETKHGTLTYLTKTEPKDTPEGGTLASSPTKILEALGKK
jgi:hypothetical protein